VAFEAHAQNVLVRVHASTKTITGFVIRDLGGLRIHPPTLCKSIGINFEFLPDHCIATKTVQDIYPKFYHTYVHNHIQRLTRLLGLHHNGVGWELLRRHMNAVIPIDHELRTLWLSPQSPTVESKCLMRMRLQDSYRDVSFSLFVSISRA
jgi:Ferric iron reductase FhuF-like transporter